MNSKSQAALKRSIQTLWECPGELYMWTFTLPVAIDVDAACKRWSVLCKALVRELEFSGIRVFELHENHGLHVHALCPSFLPVRRVRTICQRYGWGRVHVTRIRKNPFYVAKYVTKQHRAPCLAGRRIWAAVGEWASSRVKDMKCQCLKSRAYLLAQECFPMFRNMRRSAYETHKLWCLVADGYYWDMICGDDPEDFAFGGLCGGV